MVFYVKFPCAVALHFVLYPEVAQGMQLMKLANNQWDQFVNNGDKITFFIGVLQTFTSIGAEYINITLLCSMKTVERAIVRFVALQVIMEVPALYFESLQGFKIRGIMDTPPKLVHRSSRIKFSDRSPFHKFARVFYKITRTIYVSIIFYYVPFAVILK